jgi:DNA-binding SARP family transcriptional activator
MASGLVPQEHALEIAVLGAFQARVDGLWHQAPTRQVARVATILAGWPGEPVERDRIVAGVWGEKTPTTVTNTLQVHVSHLRRLIGKGTVRAQGTHYLLDLPPEAIDAEQLVEAVHEAARMRRREHYARAAELLAQATGLWRGTPFPDICDPDLEARRARLTELRDQAREDLVECRLELARDQYELADVVAEAKELVARQPLREKGHVLLVRALAAADRQGEASQAFEEAAARLRATMGLDPGRALVEVHTQALNHDDALLPRAMRRVTVLPDAPHPTPAAQHAAAQVRAAVVDLGARLVTVVTDQDAADGADALALAVAAELEPDMPEGVRILAKACTERLDGVADVVTSAPTSAQAALATRGAAAPLVVIAPKPLGLDNEVVVSTVNPQKAASTATPQRRGA